LEKQQLLENYAPLVKRIAYYMMAKLPPSVQVEDLMQAGFIGLLDAADHFDDSQGAVFETYAAQRVRGAMLDELRNLDWLPRSVRKNLRRVEACIHGLEQQLSRHPAEGEIAKALDVSLEEYRQMLMEARGYQLFYFEDFQSDEDDEGYLDRHVADSRFSPLDLITDSRFRAGLVKAIDALPEREKLMMSLYYEQELNLREIGELLGVSESRVCQMHSQAVARLRASMKDWL
jgi:RNA polymerase sigma factor for flagellar operon FliA